MHMHCVRPEWNIYTSLALARLITWIDSHVPPWYQSGLRPIGSQYEKSENDRANQWQRFNQTVYHSHWLVRSFFDFSYSLPMGRSPDWYSTMEEYKWIHVISLADARLRNSSLVNPPPPGMALHPSWIEMQMPWFQFRRRQVYEATETVQQLSML